MTETTIPRIGLGTWALTGEDGTEAILSALKVGYRHLDTAQTYDTEKQVGLAIERSGLPRDAVFVTTKITAANFPRLLPSLRESLDNLRMDQVDLTLIHWPSPNGEVPVASYIGDVAHAQDSGLTRLIGVSNFTRRLVDEALAVLGDGRIATNQVECHPYLQNKVIARHCADLGIPLTAYMPLASGGVGGDRVLTSIAERHDATPEQVALAFLLQRGHIVIPKSANPDRQRTNLAAASIELTDDEMAEIDRLDSGRRIIDPAWGPDWD